ncbi:type II toxin-antitoxin system Phd/YefM family antitoxin [Cryptosporangium aurantiacum]|uniref:Antitoxin n=1 Tax=Cryptosporangium aurantiacum TaxID=134849 RepID=A0A1M7J4F8_9ACTN|nr:type II toxin-antitoxin system Phd/YefM family antitoxin [Cryptosporangium aurantiacum]SHM47895.1 prevent-host-death family protein [Cryptosporangium aurantiacum]
MTTILPLNEVKTRFSALADEVAATHERVIVTRNGRPHVVIIAVDDLDALQMTLELATTPSALAETTVADREVADGDYLTATDVEDILARRRAAEVPDE